MAVSEAIFDGLKNVEKDILRFAMLKIEHCNANYSIDFSDAQLMFKVIKDESHDKPKKILSVRFDTLFKDGVKLLNSAFENSDHRKFETMKSYEKTAVQLLDDFFKNLGEWETYSGAPIIPEAINSDASPAQMIFLENGFIFRSHTTRI